jgi:ribonuclease D
MNKPQPSYTLVVNKHNLIHLAEKLKRESEIGVDLEADSMFHYQEKVCLIQVSSASEDILIDPLSLDDLSPLVPVFSDPGIRKVFHGADYDIRSLYRDFKIEVNNLFDTQIAASFLGIKELGLAALLKSILGIAIDKKYQKRDWSKRPLPPAMLAYAVHDSCHLLKLAGIFERELRDKKRYTWVIEECERLSKVRSLPPENKPLFVKFKNARMLGSRDLAMLESILRLREDMAKHRDRPPFKVLNNESIMEIVLAKPQSKEELERIKGLSTGQVKILGRAILKKVAEAMALPTNQLPAFPRKTKSRPPSNGATRIKKLKVWREKRAKEMNMDPALLCTNAQIESLARAFPKSRKDLENVDSLRNWQKRLYGLEILKILNPILPTSWESD